MIKASAARNQVETLKRQDSIEQLKKIDKVIETAIQERRTTVPIDFVINDITKKALSDAGYTFRTTLIDGGIEIMF